MFVLKRIKSSKSFIIIMMGFIYYLSNNLAAQDKKIEFSVDHAKFRLQENYIYLEVYYSITRNSLNFKETTDGYQALAQIKTFIKKGDSLTLVDSLLVQDRVETLEQISPSQRFTELSAIQIEEGSYLITSEFIDLNSNQKMYVADSLKVVGFSEDKLEISDIQLANSISAQKEREMKFDKNGLRVIPNASKTYGEGLYRLYFYAEAYNFALSEASKGSTYHLEYQLIDQEGELVQKVMGAPRQKPGSSSVINGCLDIGF